MRDLSSEDGDDVYGFGSRASSRGRRGNPKPLPGEELGVYAIGISAANSGVRLPNLVEPMPEDEGGPLVTADGWCGSMPNAGC